MNPKYKSVTVHNGLFVWQLTVLGKPLRSKQHFATALDAALDCDLVKHYLRTEYGLSLPASLDGEVFSNLAYSKLSVNLSDIHSVFSSLPECAKQFLSENQDALALYANEHRQPLADWEKLHGFDSAAIREWVNKCEAADLLAKEYAAVNSASFFTRLSVVDRSLDASLKSLALAVRLHGDPVPPALILRVTDLRRLIEHLTETQDYVRELTTRLRREETDATTALEKLESARPSLV